MRRVTSVFFILSLVAIFALAAGPALAQSSSKTDKPADTGQQVHDQFTRGTANVTTGWMDAPKQLVEESKTGSPVWPVTGAIKGAASAIGRTAVGGFEAVTSPVPQKEPIIKPEVFDPADKVNQGK